MDEGGEVLLGGGPPHMEDDIVAVESPLRPDPLPGDVRPEPVRIHAGRDHVGDVGPRGDGEDLVQAGTAWEDDALRLPQEALQMETQATLEPVEARADRRGGTGVARGSR